MANTEATRSERIEVFADYFQFYVRDGKVNPPAPEMWSDEDVERRAKVAESVVVMCPLRNTAVPVEVSLFAEEPPSNLADADHVVECSLALPSGHLQVLECTGGPALDWYVEPGDYAVRLSSFGLSEIAENSSNGADRYEVQLWLAPPRDFVVRKAWREHDV